MRVKIEGENYIEGVAPIDYGVLLSKGLIPGESAQFLAGVSKTMNTSATETVWAQGGDYVWMYADTQLYISSSSALDVGMTVVMTGIKADGSGITVTAVLDGQNQVAFSDMVMFNEVALVIGDDTIINGDIYIAETDTLTAGKPDTAAKIKDKIALTGTNAGTRYGSYKITHKACLLVPKGKIAHLVGFLASAGSTDRIAELGGWVQPPGGSWLQRSPIYSDGATSYSQFFNRVPLGEGLRLEFRARSSQGMGKEIGVQAQFWITSI